MSPGCIDPYNPKVVRSAMGSHFSLNWMGEKDISTLKNYQLIAADQNSKNNKLDKLIDKWALVMGSESHGLSKKTLSYVDQRIGINKIGSGFSISSVWRNEKIRSVLIQILVVCLVFLFLSILIRNMFVNLENVGKELSFDFLFYLSVSGEVLSGAAIPVD